MRPVLIDGNRVSINFGRLRPTAGRVSERSVRRERDTRHLIFGAWQQKRVLCSLDFIDEGCPLISSNDAGAACAAPFDGRDATIYSVVHITRFAALRGDDVGVRVLGYAVNCRDLSLRRQVSDLAAIR